MARTKIGDQLIALSKNVFRRIFPKRVKFPEKVNTVLNTIYPNLDFDTISYYEGLPWYIDQGFAHAITLPGVYNLNRIHIYFAVADYETNPGLSTIVHECFHALQYQELYKSRGVGLFRVFMVHYLAEFFRLFFQYVRKTGIGHARQLAYDQHPMEIPAFEIDRKFQELLVQIGLDSINKTSIPDSMVTIQTGHEYNAGRLPYWCSVLLLVFLSLIAPFMEFLFLIFAGICFALGKPLSILGI